MIKIKGICYIFAACKDALDIPVINKENNDIIIAADGGYDILKEKAIVPDVILGDFDSTGNIPEGKKIIKHPTEKDDTDTFLAYKYGYDLGYRCFVIFGGIGGRIDHTIANIRTLAHLAENGARGFLIGKDVVITAITDSITFPNSCSGYISIFSNNQVSHGISLKGLKYPADNLSLVASTTLGTSNEFLGERAQISVESGNLLVIWYEDSAIFLENINQYKIKKES